MAQDVKRGNVTVRSDSKIEVKLGSRCLLIEHSELHNLIEALSELKSLAARNGTLMNIGSAGRVRTLLDSQHQSC